MSGDTDTGLPLGIPLRPDNFRPREVLKSCLVQVVIQMDGVDILYRFLRLFAVIKL